MKYALSWSVAALLTAAVAARPLPGAAATCCLDVAAATVESPMRVVRLDAPPPAVTPVAGVAGAAYLETPLGVGKPPAVKAGKAALSFTAPADGDYILWLRAMWEGECSNSLLVRIDDRPAFVIGEDATYHAWHWVRYPVSKMAAPLRLTKGPHALTLTHREDGVRVDQILFTTDRRFVPVGVETTGVRP